MPLEKIKLLYVDDDEDDVLLVRSLLHKVPKPVFYVESAASYSEAIGKLGNNYDVFVVDYKLGKETGLEVLKAIKQYNKYAPVILLTGMENRELDTLAMQLGAADYLVKGEFDTGSLQRTIRYAIRDAILMQTLEVSANWFRNIFERSADPILLIHQDGTMVKANPAFVSQFNINPEENPNSFSFFSLLSNSDHVKLARKCIEEGIELNDLETNLKTQEGREIDALINIVMHDSQESLFQVMIKDLTALRIRDEESSTLKRFSSTGRIARIIAHEVKNPLTNITLSADQLKAELPPDVLRENAELIDIIERNCHRINQLVSDLLYSTRFTELKTGKYSINKLVEEALEMAKDRINLKKIKVVKRFSNDICDITVDGEKVKIAFLNLIVNAAEAMEEEKGVLTITTAAKDNKCVVEIIDNGPGIAPEHLDRLFEPYFTSKEKGTGLGLTNTQNIILSHKGSIRVKSERGKGTSFIVSFNLS